MKEYFSFFFLLAKLKLLLAEIFSIVALMSYLFFSLKKKCEFKWNMETIGAEFLENKNSK